MAARVEAAQNQMGSFLVGKRRPKAKASYVAQANNCFEKHGSLRIEGWQVDVSLRIEGWQEGCSVCLRAPQWHRSGCIYGTLKAMQNLSLLVIFPNT